MAPACARIQSALLPLRLAGPHPPTQHGPNLPRSRVQGGDISRKKKLLSKQAEGKKRMKALGKVEVPQAAFMAVLKIDRDGGGD